MKVKVMMVIETEDYGGREFKDEIEKLIRSVDSRAKLVKFVMCQESGAVDAWRDYRWEGPPVLVTTNDREFEGWLTIVNAFMWTERGCSVHDLPDCCLRDWFEDELGPIAAAHRAITECEEGEDYD